jgi:hypothetical protein
MDPLWKQQQRQQQMQRRRMEQAYWQQQQKAKAKKQPDILPENRQPDSFTRVEAEVAKLRREVATGRLTEERFKAQLRELMVQDERGTWWMIGYETGEWYLHDGADWVRADPPGRAARGVASTAPAKPKPRRFWGSVVLLLGLVVTFVAGAAIGDPIYRLAGYDDTIPLGCMSLVWLVGLVLTIIITRKVWRRK